MGKNIDQEKTSNNVVIKLQNKDKPCNTTNNTVHELQILKQEKLLFIRLGDWFTAV